MLIMSVGFLFSEDQSTVLLQRKARPPWQAGLYNGFGGHQEGAESPLACMERESYEETGLVGLKWRCYAELRVEQEMVLSVFRAFDDAIWGFQNRTDEALVPCTALPHDRQIGGTIPNLRWLLPLALNTRELGDARVIVVYPSLLAARTY